MSTCTAGRRERVGREALIGQHGQATASSLILLSTVA